MKVCTSSRIGVAICNCDYWTLSLINICQTIFQESTRWRQPQSRWFDSRGLLSARRLKAWYIILVWKVSIRFQSHNRYWTIMWLKTHRIQSCLTWKKLQNAKERGASGGAGSDNLWNSYSNEKFKISRSFAARQRGRPNLTTTEYKMGNLRNPHAETMPSTQKKKAGRKGARKTQKT